ncbi:MAG: hypothetical protein Q9165_000692 [Trypethelium subeluteriae]
MTVYAQRKAKLSKLPPEKLYQTAPSTLLHSLEAFFVDEDFDYDKIKHQKKDGSMMGSPSATAAYLMRSSIWDDEAEAYLRLAVEAGSGRGNGGVPSAFPSTIFEFTWAFTTLASSGALEAETETVEYKKCKEVIMNTVHDSKGVVGFAPGFEADLDDTSRANIALKIIGEDLLLENLVSRFSNGVHRPFRTYDGERDPSFTANCNALIAILLDPLKAKDFSPHNISSFYTSMLASEAMTLLLERWNAGLLQNIPKSFMIEKVILLLMQCLTRTLARQNTDGSWGDIGRVEETAYAILSHSVSSSFLFEMMVISVHNFQADEYLEAVLGSRLHDNIEIARALVDDIFEEENRQRLQTPASGPKGAETILKDSMTREIKPPKCGVMDGLSSDLHKGSLVEAQIVADNSNTSEALGSISDTLRRFVMHILQHPLIRNSSVHDHRHLRASLRAFLLAHIDQISDSASIGSYNGSSLQPYHPLSYNLDIPFKTWVRTTSACHTSCPYSFAFASCLHSRGDEDYFNSLSAKYIADDFCGSLATMCRLQNDVGSVTRDLKEGNLNGADFPEVHDEKQGHETEEKVLRKRMIDLSEYEKRRTELALEELNGLVEEKKLRMVRLFYRVTRLFGEVYMVKDLASRRLK